MATESGSTTVKSAYGKDLTPALQVNFEWTTYETLADAQKEVSEKEFIELANTRNKNNARSAAIAKATSQYKPDPNTPDEIRKRMISDMLKSKPNLTAEQAGARVDALLAD